MDEDDEQWFDQAQAQHNQAHGLPDRGLPPVVAPADKETESQSFSEDLQLPFILQTMVGRHGADHTRFLPLLGQHYRLPYGMRPTRPGQLHPDYASDASMPKSSETPEGSLPTVMVRHYNDRNRHPRPMGPQTSHEMLHANTISSEDGVPVVHGGGGAGGSGYGYGENYPDTMQSNATDVPKGPWITMASNHSRASGNS